MLIAVTSVVVCCSMMVCRYANLRPHNYTIMYTKLFHDQAQSSLDEIQLIPLARHEEAVRLLQERDRLWVGLAVVARRDSDGVYYPG